MARPAVLLALALLVAPITLGQSAEMGPHSNPPGPVQTPSSIFDAIMENDGQLGRDDILFYSTGAISAYFSLSAVEYRVPGAGCRVPGPRTTAAAAISSNEAQEPVPIAENTAFFRMDFPGANCVVPRGIEPLPFYCNYFLGNDPARWRSGVRAFGAVIYEGLYDGIDAEFWLSGGGIKYQFTVRPGADPSAIRIRYEGAQLQASSNGLLLTTPSGVVRDTGLEVFQERPPTSRFAVDARFSAAGNEVAFDVGAYDPALPLIIDPLVSPALKFSKLIGGGGDDHSAGLAPDVFGNAFVTGETLSQDFPATPGAFDNVSKIGSPPNYDVFVLKLSSDGSQPLWCTFLGSSGNDYAHGIAVDDYGFAYICGNTFDFDFPVTGFAFDSTYNGYGDAFAVKLNIAGSALVFSTFIGGEYVDHGYAIALDEYQNVYLTGSTASMEFPTTEGAFCRSIHAGSGLEDAFAAKLYANGSSLAYSTFLGGGGVDFGAGIAADGHGRAFVAGGTDSYDFPVLGGALGRLSGHMDAFVTRLDPGGSALEYSVLVGGTSDDQAASIALDGQGCAFVAGTSGSYDFPDTTPQLRPSGLNAFAFGLDSNGTALAFSRQLGGSGDDRAAAILLDPSENIYVAGATGSNNFLTTPMAAYGSPQGLDDAFLLKLDAGAAHMLYSTRIGGSGSDSAAALALDPAGRACMAGDTSSADFPVTGGPQGHNGTDAFVLKLDVVCTPTEPVLRAAAGDREVVLSWSPPEAGAGTVIRYDIYRGQSPAQLQKFISMDGGARTAHDRMVHNGETYYYAILAVNSSGEGAMSGAVQVMPGLAPTEPWGLAAMPGPQNVRLSWQAPNDTYDLLVLTYKIYRWRTFPGGTTPLLAVVNSTVYNDSEATNDIVYYYEVSAVTKIMEGPRSDPVEAMPSSVPSPPLELAADAIGRQVVLGWKAPQNPGSNPILYYNIFRRIEGDRERYYANASATVYLSGRLPAGMYFFRVAAISDTGVGYFSGEAAVTVGNRPPEAAITVEPGRGLSSQQFNFTPNAIDQDGIIANYTWHFGDGGIAYKEDPVHFFKRRGSYNVSLRVTDDDGAMTVSSLTVEVLNTPPRLSLPEPSGDVAMEAGRIRSFSISPVDPDEDVLNVTWYMDDKKVLRGSQLCASFDEAGFHRVKVVVDDGRDSDEHVWTVTVTRAPSPPSPPVYYYVAGLLSAVALAAGGLLLAGWMRRRRNILQERRRRERARHPKRLATGGKKKPAAKRPPVRKR
jgi:PKD repeat protein